MDINKIVKIYVPPKEDGGGGIKWADMNAAWDLIINSNLLIMRWMMVMAPNGLERSGEETGEEKQDH